MAGVSADEPEGMTDHLGDCVLLKQCVSVPTKGQKSQSVEGLMYGNAGGYRYRVFRNLLILRLSNESHHIQFR